MEPENPYAPPAGDTMPPAMEQPLGTRLASRGTRFCSVFIDGLLNLGVFELIRYVLTRTGRPAEWIVRREQVHGIHWFPAIGGIVIFYAVQWHSLRSSGQTLGKKLAGIRIVTMTGGKPSMMDLALKRYGFSSLMIFIPVVGAWVGLLDILFIFRKDQRCLHDMVAGTQVVYARI